MTNRYFKRKSAFNPSNKNVLVFVMRLSLYLRFRNRLHIAPPSQADAVSLARITFA